MHFNEKKLFKIAKQIPNSNLKLSLLTDFIKRKPGITLALAYLCSVIIFAYTAYHSKVLLKYDDFILSFSASLLEDLIFFFLIGIVLFILTLKKPEDNELDVRLDTVISSPNVTASARDYFRDETKSALAFYERSEVIIKISQFNEKNKTYKLFFNIYSVIINMCKDIHFELETNAYVIPGLEVNGDYGDITILEIKDKLTNNQAGELPVGIPIPLKKIGYDKTIPLRISANGKADYKFGFRIWSGYNQNERLFYTTVDRFTDSYNLSIVNDLENNFSFYVKVLLKRKKVLDENQTETIFESKGLEPGETATIIEESSLNPGDKLQFYFGEPMLLKSEINNGGKKNE